MRNPYKVIGHFLKESSGVTSIEYALIASLIAVVILIGVTSLGQNLNTFYFAKIATSVEKAVQGK